MTLGQELVSLKLRRRHAADLDARDAERRAAEHSRPLTSAVAVSVQPVKRPHAVQPATGMTGK